MKCFNILQTNVLLQPFLVSFSENYALKVSPAKRYSSYACMVSRGSSRYKTLIKPVHGLDNERSAEKRNTLTKLT